MEPSHFSRINMNSIAQIVLILLKTEMRGKNDMLNIESLRLKMREYTFVICVMKKFNLIQKMSYIRNVKNLTLVKIGGKQ